MKNSIAIIGAGNIGFSLANGLVRSGAFSHSEITLTDQRESRLEYLRTKGFKAINDNREAVSKSGIIVISVKPHQFHAVAEEIRDLVTGEHVVISTVTGVSHKEIESVLGQIPNVRIMPNIALEICQSMTCISFSNSNSTLIDEMTSLFGKMGTVLAIPEELMAAATVIGACGIAFALRFTRAMAQGGIEIGFNSDISHLITAQAVKGAAGLILETGHHPEMEIDRVTTPQGITISGLNEMEHQGLSSAVIRGLTTSYDKIGSLSLKSNERKK